MQGKGKEGRDSQVTGACTHIEQNIDSVSTALDTLETRLASVLRHVEVAEKSAKDPTEKREEFVEHADMLRTFGDRVNTQARRIQDIMDRLEL